MYCKRTHKLQWQLGSEVVRNQVIGFLSSEMNFLKKISRIYLFKTELKTALGLLTYKIIFIHCI